MLSLANKMCKNGVSIGQSGMIPASDTCRLNFMNQPYADGSLMQEQAPMRPGMVYSNIFPALLFSRIRYSAVDSPRLAPMSPTDFISSERDSNSEQKGLYFH
jgi:hypothetical protein